MKKTYVIDTNILIQAPHAFLCFEENDVVLPLVVVEELDGLRKRTARKAPMREKSCGCWSSTGIREICYRA